MNLIINKINSTKYFLSYFDNKTQSMVCYNAFIANALSIEWDTYLQILENNNGKPWINNYYAFNSLQDIEQAVTELEPYIIMKKLLGEE